MTRRWLALAVGISAGIGLVAGWLLRGAPAPPSLEQSATALRVESEASRDERGAAGERQGLSGGTGPQSLHPPQELAAAERAPAPSPREAELSQQIAGLKQRQAALEDELLKLQQPAPVSAPERQADPRAFDLSPEDWRKLGGQGTLKLRIPCAVSPTDSLSQTQLDHLGLSPADGAVVAAAFQHSADRVWALLGPMCADVLGGTAEQAAAKGPNFCRRLVLSDAAQKGTALPAFQRAAAYLAGDAPEPSHPGPVEALVLGLAKEQGLLTAELTEHLGPDEADRLVFSDGLCFTEATHQLGAQQAAPPPAK